MSMFSASVPQIRKMLNNLDGWLRAAEESATARGFDADVLLSARLAPDQFHLARQIRTSCDNAVALACRLSGRDVPVSPDPDTTFAACHARIATALAALDTFSEADFAGAAERQVTLPFLKGKWMTGAEYMNAFALPNLYFHLTTAYSILRHNGVPLGKMHYIGSIALHDVV